MLHERSHPARQFALRVLQGALIGLGAVLPGVSGGVLCAVFGLYRPIMDFLADPRHKFKSVAHILPPVALGGLIGFLGVANALSFFLEKYPGPSLCIFVGLIAGMLPALFREAGAQGRPRGCRAALWIALLLTAALLAALKLLDAHIAPDFPWYLFCGFCLALSIIAPGLSFSTLLMPLGLYEPFVSGLARLNPAVCIPGGIGAAATILLLSKAVSALFARHYALAYYAVIGVVIAATAGIIPISGFAYSAASFWVHALCIAFGCVTALLIDGIQKPAAH
ncbi:MAG: DUF368 domain-containing protein [Clostridia bacterium]|nr:DUF368 domain-containing protein [Clostridia bacterium]